MVNMEVYDGMKVLFVNACPRGEASRTLRLARTFMAELQNCAPDVQLTEHCLTQMQLQPIGMDEINLREPLCDADDWSHPFLRPAVEFHQADVIVFAAPYWDLSFPSILKVWVENIYVRNLNFRYENDRWIGLAQGKESVYIATAGSPVGDNDWGAMYMQAVMKSLGVEGFTSIRAEGIDLQGCNVEETLARAEEDARQAACQLAKRWV